MVFFFLSVLLVRCGESTAIIFVYVRRWRGRPEKQRGAPLKQTAYCPKRESMLMDNVLSVLSVLSVQHIYKSGAPMTDIHN